MAAESPAETTNPDWVALGSKATASSFYGDPPGGYGPENVAGDNLYVGWEADQQADGAWLQIDFPEPRQESLTPSADGSLRLKIRPWEIATPKLEI